MNADVKNPKLIVKNGAYLFVRLFLVMAMAFYTTRLTLQILGDEDYGINNIIGGVISMFAIISMPITGALQRFFNVEFTKEELPGRVVFSTSIRIIVVLAVGMAILYETVGLYLVNYVLNYPVERKFAVNVIFQLTVLTSILSFFSLSYSSLLYAKEDMGVPATVEILSSGIKLSLLFFIPYLSIDVLICYAFLVFLISVFQLSFYYIYCWKKYEESRLVRQTDHNLKTDILKFAGWSSINAVAGISLTYLSNIIINIFGGVLYNTAYGLSSQLSNAVVSFSTNVMKAVDPQITNTTVAGQEEYRNQVTLSAIKLSLLGVGFFYIVFLVHGNYLLKMWLGHVPNYVFEFCCLSLLSILFTSIILPLRTIIMATGEIKRLFVTYGVTALIANAMMVILLMIGFPIISVMLLILIVEVCYFFNAVFIIDKLTTLKKGIILKEILKPLFALLTGCLILHNLKCLGFESIFYIIGSIIFSFLIIVIFTYFFVLTKKERLFFNHIIRRIKNEECNY